MRRPCSTERTEGRWTSYSTREVGLPRKSGDFRTLPCGPHPHRAPEAKHSKGPHIHSDALLRRGSWGPANRGSWDLGELRTKDVFRTPVS